MKGIPGECYDSAVNMGCLQMFPEYDDRRRHFSEAYGILKPKATYFLCNHAVASKEDLRQRLGKDSTQPKAGQSMSRRIALDGKERDTASSDSRARLTKKTLSRELQKAGFRIIKARAQEGCHFGT